MAMDMDQMQLMMAKMHQQNHTNDMQLAKHLQDISSEYTMMAQQEYQMHEMHGMQE